VNGTRGFFHIGADVQGPWDLIFGKSGGAGDYSGTGALPRVLFSAFGGESVRNHGRRGEAPAFS